MPNRFYAGLECVYGRYWISIWDRQKPGQVVESYTYEDIEEARGEAKRRLAKLNDPYRETIEWPVSPKRYFSLPSGVIPE